MSVPGSMKVGPFTSKVLVKKRYLAIYLFLIWATLFTVQFEVWLYWNFLSNDFLYLLIFLPLLLFVLYLSIGISSMIYSKIILTLVNLIHAPREGTFLRHPSDKDYCYWSLRNTIKKWPVWVAHTFPFPFLDNLCFKFFGVKTKYSNSLFEGWVDTELIEFGKNVIVGQASIIQSSVIIGNLLIIRKTIINDNVQIGAHSIVMPGTMIGRNSILAANSVTTVGQVLDEGWIYLGVPATKYKENHFYEDGLEDMIESPIEDIEKLRERYEQLYIKRHDKDLSLIEKIQTLKEVKEREKERLREGAKTSS
ncbi:MAG: hypothetical protein EU548_06215 [Promethearchaeota archaeon]|nr:MAG: hypothetical protein EU548_06215 [Candidatus Lokiarchaeota archaeon]